MLLIVQQDSFLMDFLWLVVSSCSRHGSAPQLMITCVCMSLPVTMLPTVRSAGTSTAGEWWLRGRGEGVEGGGAGSVRGAMMCFKLHRPPLPQRTL